MLLWWNVKYIDIWKETKKPIQQHWLQQFRWLEAIYWLQFIQLHSAISKARLQHEACMNYGASLMLSHVLQRVHRLRLHQSVVTNKSLMPSEFEKQQHKTLMVMNWSRTRNLISCCSRQHEKSNHAKVSASGFPAGQVPILGHHSYPTAAHGQRTNG